MHKRMIMLLAVPVALLALACSSGGTGNSAVPAGTVAGGTGHAAVASAVGQPVRDGKFEFTVEKIQCGATTVGDSVLTKTAQGQFCVVDLKVTNIGKQAQIFDDSSQKAYGADGAQFSADSTAGLYANTNDNTFLNQINPGNTVTGTVVFDIPKTATLAKLELHDSPFSGGVTVTVK